MKHLRPHRSPLRRAAVLATLAIAAAGCSHPPAALDPPAPRHTLVVALGDGTLVRVAANDPSRPLHRVALQGLAPGERLLGIDFRVARGVLYGLTSSGHLATIDVATGRVTRMAPTVPLEGTRFGFDFNPVADRVRVVSDTGQNLRLHPDTGAVAAVDPPLAGDGRPVVIAAGYTYNKTDPKLTTNFAIDAAAGRLVRQGSAEGVQPVVSPNTGRIEAVGPLGTGPVDDASFDIADTDNAALAALTVGGRTRLAQVDLGTGRARMLGTLATGTAVWGFAIEP